MTQILKQSTAVDVLIGPFEDPSTGLPETGLSPAVKVSKNGQTLGAKGGNTPTHDADGYYNCELSTGNTDTVGLLTLTVATDATALGVRHDFQVMGANAYDALYGSSPTILTSMDIGLLYEGTISTVNAQTSFDCSANISTDDNWLRRACSVYDVSTGDVFPTYVADVDSANNRIIISDTPTFTVVTGDIVRVHVYQDPIAALAAYSVPTTSDTDAIQAGVNVAEVNNVTVTGSGTEADPWGPA